MEKELKFPKDFLWGTAVSAYQVEGGINCDWTKYFDAGRACEHYNLYEQDFDLMKQFNLNAFRFSIEWSRIEPEPGQFNQKEIEHYRRYLQALKNRGIKTMVTLHHFTNPLWLADEGGLAPHQCIGGGWANKKVIFYFSRFAQKMLEEYDGLVDFWLTINEPMIYATIGYLEGRWPPKKTSISLFLKVIRNQLKAHKNVYEIFHQIKPDVKVGIAKNNQFFEPFNQGSILDKFSVFLADYFWNKRFLNQIRNHLDFIGLNYYFHNKIKFPFKIRNENKITSDLGWEVYAQGIFYVLKDLKKYNLPIYITENGVADAGDKLRPQFIKDHLYWIHKAIEQGVDVKGYFHWSLMDNFEWEKRFVPRFGLVAMDYEIMNRIIRPSGFFYANICKNNFVMADDSSFSILDISEKSEQIVQPNLLKGI